MAPESVETSVPLAMPSTIRGSTPGQIRALQRAIGNQATAQLLQRQLPASPPAPRLQVGPKPAADVGQVTSQFTKVKQTKPQKSAKAGPKPPVVLGPSGVPLRDPLGAVPDGPPVTDALAANAAGAAGGGSGVGETIKTLVTGIGGGDPKAGTRVLLELTRPIPIVGMLTGMASDTIGLIQDLESIPDSGATPLATGAILTRDMLALINNIIGHAAGLNQEVETVASSTGVGAVVDVVTVPVNDGLKTIKLYNDGGLLFLDVVIASDAAYHASKSPKGSAERDKWSAIFQNFEASFATDGIGTIIDYVDLASQGFSNGDNVKAYARWAFTALKTIRPAGRTIVGVINQFLSIHGYRLMPNPFGGPAPAAGAPAAAGGGSAAGPQRLLNRAPDAEAILKDTAIDVLISELQQAHATWELGDQLIGEAEDNFTRLEAQMRALATQANGGKDPFIILRDQTRKALDKAAQSISELTAMGQSAGDVATHSESIIALSDTTLAALQGLRIPEVHVPAPPASDDSVTADLKRGAAEAADVVLQHALSPLRSAVDTLRAEAMAPVQTVKANAGDIADFSKIFEDECAKAVGVLTTQMTTLSAKLGHVQNFEQLLDVLVRQITEALGFPGGIGVGDVRKGWAEIGTTLADFEKWAEDLKKEGPIHPRQDDNPTPGPSTATPPEI